MNLTLAEQPLKINTGFWTVNKEQICAEDTLFAGWIKSFFHNDAIIVLWRLYTVEWGVVENGEIHLESNNPIDTGTIMEARVFNEGSELYAVRIGNDFEGRFIKDEGEQKIKFVDSLACLWGNKTSRQGLFVTLEDVKRKLVMKVPCKEEADSYGLVTRNYIGYAEKNGQAGYIDYRFVKITAAKGER